MLQATARLLQQIGDVQPDKLRPLLDKVFPFVSVEALRPIVVKVLSILQPVPKSLLYILAEDDDVFWDLPLSVQQQARFIAYSSTTPQLFMFLQQACAPKHRRYHAATNNSPTYHLQRYSMQ